MQTVLTSPAGAAMTLWAETAADLMTTNPVSIQDIATVREAIAFLTDKGFSAAPVIDEAGKPIGVLSRTDILIHDREKVDYKPAVHSYYERLELIERMEEGLGIGFQIEDVDRTRVSDIMTPIIFSVPLEMKAYRVVEYMLAQKVHRLFVIDHDGALIGVISAFDILRHLRREPLLGFEE